MEQTQETLPLKILKSTPNQRGVIKIGNSDNLYPMAVLYDAGNWERLQTNAEFIVRACNAHYDLIEALERIADGDIYPETLAQSVLAKTKGDQS